MLLVVKRNLSMESDDKREQGDERGTMVAYSLRLRDKEKNENDTKILPSQT